MEPHLAEKDQKLFYKYLDKATHYFEYGSGGSTYQASMRDNIQTIYAVESDLQWYNKLIKQFEGQSHITIKYCEMKAQPNNWGRPGPGSTLKQWINYHDTIRTIDKDLAEKIDLMMIDGRFRVACCLKAFNVIKDDCLIIFDDFLDRKYYHVVLDFYDIIDQTEDQRMVVLRKKKAIKTKPSEKMIQRYEKIQK